MSVSVPLCVPVFQGRRIERRWESLESTLILPSQSSYSLPPPPPRPQLDLIVSAS